MHVVINTGAVTNERVDITDSAAEATRMSFNPSSRPEVDKLKALVSAFISLCDQVAAKDGEASHEFAVAKTNAETAVMWAVKAATQ